MLNLPLGLFRQASSLLHSLSLQHFLQPLTLRWYAKEMEKKWSSITILLLMNPKMKLKKVNKKNHASAIVTVSLKIW